MLLPWQAASPPLALAQCPVCADERVTGVAMGCGEREHAVCYPCALRHVRNELQPRAALVRCPCCLADMHTAPVSASAVLDVAAWSRVPGHSGGDESLRALSDAVLARFTALPTCDGGDELPGGMFKRCPGCGEGIQHARGARV